MDLQSWLTVFGGCVILLIALVAVVDRVTRPRPVNLKGKHVLIVGGSSGIGFEMAKQAVEEGASVSVVARNQGKLKEAHDLLRSTADRVCESSSNKIQPSIFSGSADAADLKDMQRVVEESIAACGPIHAVICCQGICRPYTFDDWKVEEMREHMEANFWGTVNVLKAGALESVKTSCPHGTGRVLIVSSQAGQTGVYGYSAYAASKFALRGLAECLQQELIPYGVKVGMLFPPDTDTPQLHEESKTKTAITKLMSAQSGPPMKASHVAAAGLCGMKKGEFMISANFTGYMLNVATAGMAPAYSVGSFMFEVILAGLMRIVAILTLADFDKIIRQNFKPTV